MFSGKNFLIVSVLAGDQAAHTAVGHADAEKNQSVLLTSSSRWFRSRRHHRRRSAARCQNAHAAPGAVDWTDLRTLPEPAEELDDQRTPNRFASALPSAPPLPCPSRPQPPLLASLPLFRSLFL